MDAKNTVTILDSTLRDGAQGEGISFSLQDKISIVQILDELGVTYIEAGNPSSNPKDELFFAEMKNIKLANAKLAAFGSTRRKNTKCEKDENLLALLKADTPVVTLFGKSWAFQVTDILHTSLQQNLDMIYESVKFCVSHGKEVIFDAEHFFEGFVPQMSIVTGLQIGIVVLVCTIVSILFCMVLKLVGKSYGKIPNKYSRIVVAAGIVIVVNLLLQTTDYMGAGTELIVKAVQFGEARPWDFFWKLVLTALTMKAGFKGGEIVPSFCIGATLGCAMGQLIGFEPRLCAACGMIAFFCAVTNCPITSMLIAFELFGFEGVSYYLVAVAVSYATSGYYSLYKDQTIVYSKYKAKYVNQKTRT